MPKGIAFVIKFKDDFEEAKKKLIISLDLFDLPGSFKDRKEYVENHNLIYNTEGNKTLLAIVPCLNKNPKIETGRVRGLIRRYPGEKFKIVGGAYYVDYGVVYDGKTTVKIKWIDKKTREKEIKELEQLDLPEGHLFEGKKKCLYIVLGESWDDEEEEG